MFFIYGKTEGAHMGLGFKDHRVLSLHDKTKVAHTGFRFITHRMFFFMTRLMVPKQKSWVNSFPALPREILEKNIPQMLDGREIWCGLDKAGHAYFAIE